MDRGAIRNETMLFNADQGVDIRGNMIKHESIEHVEDRINVGKLPNLRKCAFV